MQRISLSPISFLICVFLGLALLALLLPFQPNLFASSPRLHTTMAPAATTSAAADPYACASYPSLDGATSAPPAYWPADRNATAGQRACTAFPNYYMVQCCGSASAGAGSASAVVREPKCGWEVCISSTTDAQWEACFKALDAQRGNVSDKGYTYKCASGEKKKEEEKMSGARRAVVGAAVVVAACMALAL